MNNLAGNRNDIWILTKNARECFYLLCYSRQEPDIYIIPFRYSLSWQSLDITNCIGNYSYFVTKGGNNFVFR